MIRLHFHRICPIKELVDKEMKRFCLIGILQKGMSLYIRSIMLI